MNLSHTKICLLPARLGLGGPASFQGGLINAFKSLGVAITHDSHEAGLSAILVFGAGADIKTLKDAQRAGVRVVQRLNGMNWIHRRKFTGLRHFIKAEAGNFKLRVVRGLADRVIYQSRFAREWWERENGVLQKPQAVIYNGVDLDLFSPQPDRRPSDHYRLLMVEAHHGGGYDQGLRSGVQLAAQLRDKLDKPVKMVVVGDVPANLRQSLNHSWIEGVGVVEHTAIPEINRAAHLFFSGDINAACPNAALEAMACGVPVLAYDTGAMAEIITPEAGRVVPYGGDVWKLEQPDVLALSKAANDLLSSNATFRPAARQHAERQFNIQFVARQYLEILLGD